jgi:hypothetical protein
MQCKKRNNFQVGFIDPNRVNGAMIQNKRKETEDILLEFLLTQEYRARILFPYNCRWVLLSYIQLLFLLDVISVIDEFINLYN